MRNSTNEPSTWQNKVLRRSYSCIPVKFPSEYFNIQANEELQPPGTLHTVIRLKRRRPSYFFLHFQTKHGKLFLPWAECWELAQLTHILTVTRSPVLARDLLELPPFPCKSPKPPLSQACQSMKWPEYANWAIFNKPWSKLFLSHPIQPQKTAHPQKREHSDSS